jgi:AmiR/NasT family two-component response regulator
MDTSASGDLHSHRLLGQAVGILMERYEIGEDRALHCLQRVADSRQVDLREVARIVVQAANERAGSY